MTDVIHKKSVRCGHRASATKMVHKTQDLLSWDPMDYAQLAKTRLSLQEKVSVLKKLDAEIVDSVKEEEVAEEIEKTDMYMEDVYVVLAKLEEALNKSLSRPFTISPSATASDDATAPGPK